jgi:hypothetical protein
MFGASDHDGPSSERKIEMGVGIQCIDRLKPMSTEFPGFPWRLVTGLESLKNH